MSENRGRRQGDEGENSERDPSGFAYVDEPDGQCARRERDDSPRARCGDRIRDADTDHERESDEDEERTNRTVGVERDHVDARENEGERNRGAGDGEQIAPLSRIAVPGVLRHDGKSTVSLVSVKHRQLESQMVARKPATPSNEPGVNADA